MSWKSLTCVTVFCALLAGQAMAAPTLSVTGSASGANTLWTVSVTPDAALLDGAMALELAIEFPTAQTLVGGEAGVNVSNDWHETLLGVEIRNPGENPYEGENTEFIRYHPNVASQIPGGTGNVNAIFAALGSTIFTAPATPTTVMTFTTAGTTGEVSWNGFLAQDPMTSANFYDVSGSAEFPDGPDFIPGDFNGSGQVEAGDLNLVLDNWGQTVPPIPPMWTGDQPLGLIEAGELNAVLDNWGNVAPGALVVSAAAVPEPASVASLLGFIGLGALTLRSRKSA